MKKIRQDSLETIGLSNVLEIIQKGRLPISTEEAVEKVFGAGKERGALVISGGQGIVGSGKAMQLGSRLLPYGVPLVTLDLPDNPQGISKHYAGLCRAFGREKADEIFSNFVQLFYNGKELPSHLSRFRPRFLLEAIPEILELKRSHYELFRRAFPEIEIRSVTSGFPKSKLGVPIAHPAFPHEINKVYEVVEDSPSPITHLLWSLGLIPLPVSDHYSFVLDVLFCGITLAALRFKRATNMPYWKVDKFVRYLLGPNPFRAHDAIGAKGANFLTWSCLHYLAEEYGGLFRPTEDLIRAKEYGTNWYPPNHLRPMVNWKADRELLETYLLGALVQMTSLMLQEGRAHLSHMNLIGELCAQFRKGAVAVVRSLGKDKAIQLVERYHKEVEEAKSPWFPDALDKLESPEGQFLYVNALHDGKVGALVLSRESYNWDVNEELNRAIDWLKQEGIERVILTSDFHTALQLVGADTSEFFPALEDMDVGRKISLEWSKTARRLCEEFQTSVGLVVGKRCLGGMLELLLHCHYVFALEDTLVGFPEVTLPVVPGMEGCHLPFRKAPFEYHSRILALLLEGKAIPAKEAAPWLLDRAGTLEEVLTLAWKTAIGEGEVPRRTLEKGAVSIPDSPPPLSKGSEMLEKAREAIFRAVKDSCQVNWQEALKRQAEHSANFMASPLAKQGFLGNSYARIVPPKGELE